MEISARFSHDKLDPTKTNTPHLVVSLTAPTLDWVTKRPALCVLPLIDLSGSMRGEKLEYAKKSLHILVDQLQPGDIAGLVGFEDRHHVFVEPAPVTADLKAKLHTAIDKLHTLGGTNLCSGILESLKLVNGLDLSSKYLKRVIMFTDGQPTTGVTDQKDILRFLESNLGSITVSAFGYGNLSTHEYNGCDQAFLTTFAQTGKGNYAYVQSPDESLTAFGRELGGLLSTYAQDILVEIEPDNGHQITKVVTDVKTEQNALGEVEFKLSDILSEETRHFVFEVSIQKQGDDFKPMPRPLNAFSVRVSYSVLTENGQRETKQVETKARLRFVDPEEAQKDPDKVLDEIIAMAQVVRAQLEAEEQAKKGEHKTAGGIMEDLAAQLARRGHQNTSRLARGVSHRLASPAMYASSEGYLRTTASAGTRGYGMSAMDGEAAADLLDAGAVLANSSMSYNTNIFQGSPAVPPQWQVAGGQPGVNLVTPAGHPIDPEAVSALWSSISTPEVEQPLVTPVTKED
jgi:Ca-activated chloride channel homolog